MGGNPSLQHRSSPRLCPPGALGSKEPGSLARGREDLFGFGKEWKALSLSFSTCQVGTFLSMWDVSTPRPRLGQSQPFLRPVQ